MSSVDPNGKEAVRRREAGERGSRPRAASRASCAFSTKAASNRRRKSKRCSTSQPSISCSTAIAAPASTRWRAAPASRRSRSTATSAASNSCSKPSSAASSSSIGAACTASTRRCAAWTCARRSITVAETILGIITTDRTLALRRLIFDEATRSPEVGQHYYKIGPGASLLGARERARDARASKAISTFRRWRATSRASCLGA